jgi:hypothetical protein
MHYFAPALAAAAALTTLLGVIVRDARADERVWRADRAEREAGVRYTWRCPPGREPYLERYDPTALGESSRR